MARNFGLISKRAELERKRTFNPEAADPPFGDWPRDPKASPPPSPLPIDNWVPFLIIALLVAGLIFVVITYFVTAARTREADLLTMDCQVLLKDEAFKPYDCLRVFMADDPLDAAEQIKCGEKWRNGWHDGYGYWNGEELVVNCGEPPEMRRSMNKGRYNPHDPLAIWFDHLASGKGLCCSFADGFSVQDVDWDTLDGRYRVHLRGEWVIVPENALVTEPNRFGPAVVWPYTDAEGAMQIRCFLPGAGA